MLPSIEKLLILQDRDRKLFRARAELGSIAPQRQLLQSKLADVQSKFEAAKNRGKHVESERKRLELEVESKKQLIQKYSLQQFQTKKNEEYRALAHEIDMCKEAITKLEDQQLEFMEQAEQIAKETAAANTLAQSQKRDVDKQIADLVALEGSLKKQIAEDESTRATLGAVVDPSVLSRYERLLKSKGENVVVGKIGRAHV